jgi:hypothetical protein
MKPFLLLIIAISCFKTAHTQLFDTFYVVSQYWLRSDGLGWLDEQGNASMQVYLPNNQQLNLFAKQRGKKPLPLDQPRSYNRQTHCLRIIKQRDSLLVIRIVAKDSVGKRRKPCVTVDTTVHITEVPFNRNIVTVYYFRAGLFRFPQKLMISNRPRHMTYIPHMKESKRKRYLNRYLKGIQYEYNAVTGQLIQLY